MQNLYAVACGSSTPSQLSTHLIQAIFLNLKDVSLQFLLGVLLARSPGLELVRTHALLHALAFLRGHTSSNAVDFQTVLPSFIAVLMDARTDKQGRALIFECVSALASISERKHVYGLDSIYGAESCRCFCASYSIHAHSHCGAAQPIFNILMQGTLRPI